MGRAHARTRAIVFTATKRDADLPDVPTFEEKGLKNSEAVTWWGLAAPAGALYRLDDRGVSVLLDGLIVPNGLAFSPDGRTMYLSDSHPSRATVWAI